MAVDNYVKISDCEIGIDSNSGKAFSCEIDGVHYWVPYSVCRKRSINTKIHSADSIEVAAWWVEKNELEGEPMP